MSIARCIVLGLLLVCVAHSSVDELYSWLVLDYDWISEAQKIEYFDSGLFVPFNNCLAGIKVWKNDIYVTVPRWRDGVPSTLNKIIMKNGSAVLQPYPSWEMQELGNPNALQYIQSMEIDTRGWMWILDVARIDLEGTGVPKLIIWDIEKNCSVRKYWFPDDVLPHSGSFANDIVVDETAGFAYISDTWGNGGIVVYDFNKNLSRRFGDDPSLLGNDSNIITVNGIGYNIGNPTDGIALSSDFQTLYYCSLSRQQLFAVPTALLKNFEIPSIIIGRFVALKGIKGYSDGMTTSSNGIIYYGDIENNAVSFWDTSLPFSEAQQLVSDTENMQWPDTFAWDTNGNIYFVSNKLQKFLHDGMKFDGTDGFNFRIWRVFVNERSYLYGKPIPSQSPCFA